MDSILVKIAPELTRTRLLVTTDGQDVLKAVLGPSSEMHPRAAATLLEGLALWQQRRLSVVLCADELPSSSVAMGLCDALGFGQRTVHYDVGVAMLGHRRRRIDGLGDFRDLRRIDVETAL